MAPNLNVAYFSNQFADQEGYGLARYARELFHELAKISHLNITPVAAWSSMPREALQETVASTGLRLMPMGRRVSPIAWTFFNALPIERWLPDDISLVHAASLGYPVTTKKRFVVTIHDLGPLTHPEFFNNDRPWVMQRSLDRAVKQADAIICVSQSTADEVASYVGGNIQDRLHVVYEGVSSDFFEPFEKDECLTGLALPPSDIPFILAAGKLSPRKNIQGIVAAMKSLKSKIPHHLVLVGGQGWDMKTITDTLDDPELAERIHFTGFVDDLQLKALYARAALYVHPSLYEGFGLTVLEAMAMGAPVITSNTSSLPEVAGDAGLLVDPKDTASLIDAIIDVCCNPEMAKQMSLRGKQHAANFTWSDCAAKVSAIYSDVCG